MTDVHEKKNACVCVDPENKLLAQSTYEFAAKYDGISLDILKEDIAKIVEKKK